MTPEQFCYWLRGFAELNIGCPDDVQWTMIKDHLDTVFNKVTPDRTKKNTKELLTEELKRVNPFDQPGVYCTSSSDKRIC